MSYFFFPWKRYSATHSLLFEFCGIFFFPDPEKKIQSRKFRLFRFGQVNPDQYDKKMILWVKVPRNYKFTPCYRIFLSWKWWSRIYYAYFFFPRKLGAGKKNTAIFTHSLLFWDFHPKSNFSREKKIRHLCSNADLGISMDPEGKIRSSTSCFLVSVGKRFFRLTRL